MKSIWLKIVVVVVVLLALLYVGINYFTGSLVTKGVNLYGPQLTKTEVSLKGAEISPLSGSGTLDGLYVGNPKGWPEGKAFSLGKIHLEVVPSSIFGDHIIVKDVEIEKPDFVYLTKVVSSNIGDLLKELESSQGQAATQAKTKSGAPIKFEVQHLALTGGQVTLGVGPTAVTVPMPPISLNNLGTAEGGITSDQLAVAVMRAISGSVVQATVHAASQVGSTMGAAAGNAAKNATNGLKGLFGK